MASTLVCAICTVPFYILIFIKGPLVYFLVMFAFLSKSIGLRVPAALLRMTHSLSRLRLLLLGLDFPGHSRACRGHAKPRRRRLYVSIPQFRELRGGILQHPSSQTDIRTALST